MTFAPNNLVTYIRQPRTGVVQIANADGQNQKTVVTAGSNGSKVVALAASSTDTSSRDIQVALVRGATAYILATTTVAAGSGNAAASGSIVDLLAAIPNRPVDNDGQRYIFLESGDTLAVSALTTVTSGKVVAAIAEYGDF